MKTVYIHIGTFKTGTTSIQLFLKNNRERLQERGIYIPTTPILAHHPLPLSLIKQHSRWRAGWREFEGGPEEIWDRFVAEVEATDCQKILISSESFCDLVNENCREKSQLFAEFLKSRLGPYNVKIICYLRSIAPYLKGIYQESIKITSRKISFADEINNLFNRDSIHTRPSLYLDFYADIFGEDSLIVREYSKDKLLEGDSVKDLLSILGCADLYTVNESIKSNPSLDDIQLSYKKALNAYTADSYALHQELADLIYLSRELGSQREIEFSIPTDIMEKIDEQQKTLEARYGVRLEPAGAVPHHEGSQKPGFDYDLLVLSLLSKIIAQNELLISGRKTGHRSAFGKLVDKARSLLRSNATG